MKKQQTKYVSILILVIGWMMLCSPAHAIANGDLNNDGQVNLNDAIPVLQVMVDLYTPTAEELSRGDFDGNGKIGVEDAIGILQSVAGIRSDIDGWTDVNVTPPAAILTPNSTQSFAAAVSGIQDQRISWKIEEGDSGGKVSDNGIYTAPSATGLYYLVATSLADPEISIKVPISVISPPPSDPGAREILSLAYYHVQDSDGSKFRDDVICVLVFEANGVAHIYVSDPTDSIAYKGSYSYSSGGSLSLKFTGEDFKPDVTFPLDRTTETVTMPFNILSSEQGSSTWQQKNVSFVHNMRAIFYSLIMDEPDSDIYSSLERVRNYVNTAVMVEAQNSAGKRHTLLHKADENDVKGTMPLDNGVTVIFEDGSINDIVLFNWTSAGDPNSLFQSPLASDPRVHINPKAPGTSDFDPEKKTMLFIAPFYSTRYHSWIDYCFVFADKLVIGLQPQATENFRMGEVGQSVYGNAMEELLESNGYQVKKLIDDDVDLLNLIDELIQSPGFIVFNTHGIGNGSLATGIYLGNDLREAQLSRYEQFVELENTRHSDFLKIAKSATGTMSFARQKTALDVSDHFLTVTPRFWKWLREKKGADFSNSLFYNASCLTDRTNELRDEIRAGAYFAYNLPSKPITAGAIFQYLVQHLSKNTHSAEEAYYNIIRIANTHQMIYTEDSVFQGISFQSTAMADWEAKNLIDYFNGHYWNGNVMVSYKDAGWLAGSPTQQFNQGDVWWLTFTGRWGTENNGPEAGADNLITCWDEYWSKGETAGLGSQLCNAMDPGRAPTQDEVAYATYLITGTPRLPFSGIKADRWTLNDAE